jgi:hypothetical protein
MPTFKTLIQVADQSATGRFGGVPLPVASPVVAAQTLFRDIEGGGVGAVGRHAGVLQRDESTVTGAPRGGLPGNTLINLDKSQVSVSPSFAPGPAIGSDPGPFGDVPGYYTPPFEATLSWPNSAEWDGASVSAEIRHVLTEAEKRGPGVYVFTAIQVAPPYLGWFGSSYGTTGQTRAAFEATRNEENQTYTVEFFAFVRPKAVQSVETLPAEGPWPPGRQVIITEYQPGGKPTVEMKRGDEVSVVTDVQFHSLQSFSSGQTLYFCRATFPYSTTDPNPPIRLRITDDIGHRSKWYRLRFAPVVKAQGSIINLDNSRATLPDDLEKLPVGAHLEYDLEGSFDPDGELGYIGWFPNYYARAGWPGHYQFEDGEYEAQAVPSPQQQYLSDTTGRPTGAGYDQLVVTELDFKTRVILPDQGRYNIAVSVWDKDGITAFSSPQSSINRPVPYEFLAKRTTGGTDARSGIVLAAFGQPEQIESARYPGTFRQTWRQYSIDHYDGSTPNAPITMDFTSRSAPFKVWKNGAYWFCCQCNGVVSRYPEVVPNIVFNPETDDFETAGDVPGWKQIAQIVNADAIGDYGNFMMIGCEMSHDGGTIYILARVWGDFTFPYTDFLSGQVVRHVLRRNAGGQYVPAAGSGETVAALTGVHLGPGELRQTGAALTLIAQSDSGILIKASRDEMKNWE